MVRGKLNKQIAHQLGTSERTVKAHRHMVMQKLQVQSFAEAVSIAERVGQLTPPPSSDAKGVHRASLRSTISFSHLVAGLRNRQFAPKDNIAPRRAVVCCGRVETVPLCCQVSGGFYAYRSVARSRRGNAFHSARQTVERSCRTGGEVGSRTYRRAAAYFRPCAVPSR
jgi:Bacterial regulatory proteins, luxR family